MKRILALVLLLCSFYGCASSSGGGYVVGNGFAPAETGVDSQDQDCQNGKGSGCKKK